MRDPVDVRVPGDKSITHRALILASLADGGSRIRGALDAGDTRSTAGVLGGLGADIPPLGPELVVRGAGLAGLMPPHAPLDCGNSGTTARLLLGVLAGCPFEATLTGDASLRARPMRRVTEPLAAAGTRIQEVEAPDRLPVRVHGRRPLEPIRWDSPVASAQVKSALLLAGLTGRAPVEVREPARSRDHTERMLRAMGVPVRGTADGAGYRVAMEPVDRLGPLDLEVPGDLSSAAFLLALAAMTAPVRIRGVGLNPGRTGVLDVLARMGAAVRVTPGGERCGEPVGDVVVAPGDLTGVRVGPAEVPALLDEVPALAVLAARARGETRFDGIAELRRKESDRVAALAGNLRALGVPVEEGADWLAIEGREGPLEGRVDAHEDHRIAMAFLVLAATPGTRITVHGADTAGISFPDFADALHSLRKELLAS